MNRTLSGLATDELDRKAMNNIAAKESRWRIYMAFVIAPLAAPIALFSLLLTIDAFTRVL
jgi:hypothetical protein